jgi:hypothetical protein
MSADDKLTPITGLDAAIRNVGGDPGRKCKPNVPPSEEITPSTPLRLEAWSSINARQSNKPHVFKDRDVRRLVKAVRATGEHVARIEVDPYTDEVAVVTRKPGANGHEPSATSHPVSP